MNDAIRRHDKVNQELLLRRLKEGHEAAYERLFKEYYQMLTLYANKYLEDIELAKETVQDLFVGIYEKRTNLDINSSLKSYLFRSVHNRCINQINSGKVRTKYAKQVIAYAEKGRDSVHESMCHAELEEALHQAISELPPKCQKIFTMNRFEGLSNSQIADELALSKRTVETQISKALKILREKLQPYMAVG